MGFRSFLFCLAWLHTLRAASGHSTVWLGFPLGSAWRGASYLLVLHHCVPFQGWHFPMACVLQCLSCSFKMKCTFERTGGLLEATFGHVFRENTVAFALAVNSPLAQMAECHCVHPIFGLYNTDSNFAFPLGVFTMVLFWLSYHRENSLKPIRSSVIHFTHISPAPTEGTPSLCQALERHRCLRNGQSLFTAMVTRDGKWMMASRRE